MAPSETEEPSKSDEPSDEATTRSPTVAPSVSEEGNPGQPGAPVPTAVDAGLTDQPIGDQPLLARVLLALGGALAALGGLLVYTSRYRAQHTR